MPLNLKGIFSTGAKELIGTVGNVLDNLITNPEERAKAKLEIDKEANRHIEVMEATLNKEYELEIQDRSNARAREAEFVKATGHVDYMMWFLAISAVGIFMFVVWHLISGEIPKENREILIGVFGVLETVLISMFTYYWGSSAGSRIKDMRSGIK